jgi:hypothetical protein
VKRITKNILSLMKFRPSTRIWLTVFLILVIGVIFVGLNDLPGYILGYLATAVLFIMATRTWHTIKQFLILFAVSLIGIIFLSFFYVEVVCRLAVMVEGDGALQGAPLRFIEVIFTYIILFAGATGMLYGIAGAITLSIFRLINLISHKNITENT